MEFFVCYEDAEREYADGYESLTLAEEYAEEIKSFRYANVRVLTKKEYEEEWALESN